MSGELDDLKKEEYDEPGSESGSAGTFVTILGGLLHGVGLTLGITFYADEFFNGDGGSLVFPWVKMFMER